MSIPEKTMQNLSRKNFFSYSYLFGLFLLVGSLPYSKFLISVAEIILFLSWLSEGGFKVKLNLFLKNKIALALSSLFILHLLGLLYTSDFQYGLEDIKKKIPLMLLPLIFSSSPPLSRQMFEKLLSVFTLSVVIATWICFYVLLGYTSKQILQPQQASIFTSHIRFGLLISLSIFILGYFTVEKRSVALKIVLPLLIIWLITFLIMMESATGLVCTVAVAAALFIRLILKTGNSLVKLMLLALFIVVSFFAGKLFYSTVAQFENLANTNSKQLLTQTKKGNPYTQDTLSKEIENGNFVWLNVCEKELEEEWSKKSRMNYQGKDLRGNELKYTLIRFLTSKGLNKDAEGVAALSDKEVHAIEKGIPDVNYISVFNPTARLQKIVWEFDTYLSGGNPSGHSVVQRFEFWKASWGIIKENPLIGVGTGDVKNAFEAEYDKMNSPLTKVWRLRSHNQFLAICTAFGILGLIWFLITLFYPLFADKKFNDYFYLVFFIIAFLSMFGEDTLETQAGVTFFAFFNSFFLFLRKEND
jgi:hypothetical protein